jgi:hypothetical protein
LDEAAASFTEEIDDNPSSVTGEGRTDSSVGCFAGEVIDRFLMEDTKSSTMIVSSSSVLESQPDVQNLPPMPLPTP